MPASALSRQSADVALVTIANPPANVLTSAVLADLLAAFATCAADPSIRAIVLTGADGIFTGGADIHGFSRAALDGHPSLWDLIDAVESSAKPVVAAIAGVALGGGVELALACDGRVVAPTARLGLPEIALGLIPGAGGTQRLPRLIGVAGALAMIVTGTPVAAADAVDAGLVDELADDPVAAAARLALAFARAGRRRRTRDLVPAGAEAELAAARAKAPPLDRGGEAVHAVVDAVAASTDRPFAAGLAFERAAFLALLDSTASQARRHLFFAERRAAKPPLPPETPPYRAHAAAVIGAGTMGAGIATAFADAGVFVTLIDTEQASLDRARAGIAANYTASVRKGRLRAAQMDARLGSIETATTLESCARADVVVEAVFEDLAIKRELFARLDAVARPGALLATNTSTLDIDALASATTRPADVVGMHFFSPANVMRLLEVVRGAGTSATAVAHALAIGKMLGKTAVVAGNADGFIGNRMLYRYRRQAEFLLEEGALPERIDAVLRAFGFAMGPFAVADLAGLDIGWAVRKRRNAIAAPIGRYSRVADRLCELGRFGQKTGAGYYRYESGGRAPLADPLVTALIEDEAHRAGIEPRTIADGEIVERCVYALVNEAAILIEEGIAARAGDVDVVWVHGYGFPAFRGGPLFYADTVGLPIVAARMHAFADAHGEDWRPAPLLERLARAGSSFAANDAAVAAT